MLVFVVYLQKDNLTTMFSPFGNVLGVSVMPNHKSGYVTIATEQYNAGDISILLVCICKNCE